MDERRGGKPRRSSEDRRKGGASSYNGPERRSQKYRRSDTDRRKKIGKTKLALEHERKQIESPLTRRRMDSIGHAATGNALAVSVRTITSV